MGGLCTASEDIQDQARTIQDFHLQFFLNITELLRTQLIIKDHQADLILYHILLNFLQFTGPDKSDGIRVIHFLGKTLYRIHPCRIGQESQFVQIFLNLLLILLGGNQTHQNGLFGLCLRYDKFFHATKIYYFNYLRIFANIFTNINQLSYEKENLASIQMRCRLYGIPIRTTIYPVTSFKSIYMGKFCAK